MKYKSSKVNQITKNPDLFYQRLTFDGLNISQIEYYNGCTPGRIKNKYLYDADHRLIQTTNFMYTPTRVQDNYSSSYSYDLAGNLLTLTRNGFLGMDANNEPTYGLIDQLIYDYDDDLFLKSVENDINVASEDFGFKGEIGGYAYDDRGNMITSTLNDLTIDYNHINLPGVLSSDFGSQTTHYSLGGSKIMTVNQYADPPTGFPEDVTRVYFMGMELEYEGVGNFSSNFTPKAYHFGDGRLLFDGNDTRKQYHLHDHLGNVVVVFEDKNKDGFIEETDNPNTNEVPHRYHYYSFGMLWDLSDPLTPLYSDDNRYLYNGKEFERVANLLDYGWRWFDPVVGRWNGVDPLAETYTKESPYNYVGNNPITYIDVKGKFRLDPNIIRDYPHFASFIQNNVIELTNSNRIMTALSNYTNLNPEQIINDFTYGDGPLIVTGNRGENVFGQYNKNDLSHGGNSTIFIDEGIIADFEKSMNMDIPDKFKTARLLGTTKVLLHEFVHHGGGNKAAANNMERDVFHEVPEPNNFHDLLQTTTLLKTGNLTHPLYNNQIKSEHPEAKDKSVLPRLPNLN